MVDFKAVDLADMSEVRLKLYDTQRIRLGSGADDMPAELTELKVHDVAI
jgi:hypothetical protein